MTIVSFADLSYIDTVQIELNTKKLSENIIFIATHRDFIILSDNKSVLEKLSYPNNFILYTLNNSVKNIKILWVKNYSNYESNNMVDNLVKGAVFIKESSEY